MLLSTSRGRPDEFGGPLLYASLIGRSVSWSETKDGEQRRSWQYFDVDG